MAGIIREIQAKTILSSYKTRDSWFGIRYCMNIYRGCPHQCIYCDSRSECYGIEDFNDVLVKVNAVDLLKKELPKKRTRDTIGTGSMSDPYNPLEKEYGLAGRALEVIAQCGFPVHIITKSNMVVKDIDKLCDIGRVYAAVSFTVTTADDGLAAKLEPGAPSSTLRLKAMGILAAAGIYTGITMMPILPYIEDNEENIRQIVEKAAAYGARYILPAMGVTMRDRQRAYYYNKLEGMFPGLRQKYEKSFGNRYMCGARKANFLGNVFIDECRKHGVPTRMEHYSPKLQYEQMRIF